MARRGMAYRQDWLERFSFGGRIPGAIGLTLVVTVASSLLVAFGSRHAEGIFAYAPLVPNEVWRGQVWRLVTWPFIEPAPLSLVFTCLFLFWFGVDLAREWGPRRFLFVYGGVAL